MASEFKWRGAGVEKLGELEQPSRRSGLPPLLDDAGALGRQRRRRRADKEGSIDDAASVAGSVATSAAAGEHEAQTAASRDVETASHADSASGTGRRRRREARSE